jgi:hypothetical protein
MSDLPTYMLLAKLNKVEITNNIELTADGNFFTDAFQRGVRRRIGVGLVVRGDRNLVCPDDVKKQFDLQTDMICIDTGRGSVEEVVRSEQFQVGTKREWLLMGNHRWKWTDLEREIVTAKGKKAEEKRKFMVILVYDDFGKQWQVSKIDFADRTDQFAKQQEFDNFVAQARFAGGATQK